MELIAFSIYGFLGLFAGIVAGLFGVGGGLIIVPVLLVIFRNNGIDESVVMHMAIGSSLATIVVTSLGSMIAHHKRGSLSWDVFIRFSPGIVAGALTGAWMAEQFSTSMLQQFVAILVIVISIQLIFDLSVKAHNNLPGIVNLSFSGGIIGLLSSMAGIGGGSLTVPYLVWHKVPMIKAVGTAAACGLPIAIFGALGFFLTGLQSVHLNTAYTTGYLYWPAIVGISVVSYLAAPIGVRLAHGLPVKTLKRLFSTLLVLLGFYLFISA